MMHPAQPIGIFDSGIGGLTVTHAIVNRMPEENIIYFGDTAHLPYGDKSAETLRARARHITGILLAEHCKMILIACNSATSAAADAIRAQVGERALVVDVINPVISTLAAYPHHQMGLIGTRQTVRSGVYQQKLAVAAPHIALTCKATNLLAAAIEEFGASPVTESLIREYLAEPAFHGIESLLLACTHYPVIKDQIARFFKGSVQIIDPTDTIAATAEQLLVAHNLRNTQNTGHRQFYVSDFTEAFAKSARRFFSDNLTLRQWQPVIKETTDTAVPA